MSAFPMVVTAAMFIMFNLELFQDYRNSQPTQGDTAP